MNRIRSACFLIALTSMASLASAQVITLATNPASPATYGQAVTLISQLVGAYDCNGDTVAFYEVFPNIPSSTFNGLLLGTTVAVGPPPPFPICVAVLPANELTSSFSVGTHYLQAYSAGFTPNSALTLVVNQAGTSTSLGTMPNPSIVNQSVTLTATVSPAGAGGSVAFYDGQIYLGSNSVSSTGVASISTSGLIVGNHNLLAVYGGNSNYIGSQAGAQQSVNQIITSTSLQVSPPSVVAGNSVNLTATVSPSSATGTITFRDGNSSLGAMSLNGGTASLSTSSLAPGVHSLTASYGGDTNNTGSTSSPATETVLAVTSTTLASNPNPSIAGQSVILTATVTPSSATGPVSFYDGGSLLGSMSLSGGSAVFSSAFPALGNHSLTASYGGDAIDATSTSAAVTQSVVPSGGGGITSLSPSTAAAGGAAFTLTVNGSGFNSTAVVQWNGTALNSNPVSDTQVTASVPANLLASPGAVPITVVTAGGTAGPATFTVNPAGQMCSFMLKTSSAGFAAAGGSGTISVTASRSDCTWTGATTASWISGFNSVTGSGTLQYAVAENTAATDRFGFITIGSQSFKVTQGGTNCSYSLPFATQAFSAAGGAGTAIIHAPPGCQWTAASASPSITFTSPASGSGDGTVTYNVAPSNTAATLTGALTVAGRPYSVVQLGGGSSQHCTASVPAMTQAALEGRTETLGDFLVNCTGLTGAPKADITLTLNTNVTNMLTGGGNLTDAVLTVNGGAPVNGIVGGYNSLRWFGVPVTPNSDGSATLRISKVRADASLLAVPGNLQPTMVTGRVSIKFLSPGGQSTLTEAPVTGAQQAMASAAPMLLFSKSQANPPGGGGQTSLPLLFQEGAAAAFQAGATRLMASIANVPAGVLVYAPTTPSGGNNAQLMSADSNGVGGSPITGTPMAGANYYLLPMTGGKATATWQVSAADAAHIETLNFPLLLMNAASGDLNQLQISGSLAPISDVTIASANAPPTRYRSFNSAVSLVNLQTGYSSCQVNTGLPALDRNAHASPQVSGNPPTCGGNVSNFMVINNVSDPSQTANNVHVTGNVSSGGTITGCSGGMGCSQSGNQATVNCGNLGPGQMCSGSIMTQPDPTVQGGTVVDNSVSASSDEANSDPTSATSDSTYILLTGSPAAVMESPASGAGGGQSFTFQFSDPSGYQSLGVVNVLINNFLDGRKGCYLAYSVPTSTLYLVDDGGEAGGPYAGGVVLGNSSVIQNSQCGVSLTSASGSGNTLTLVVNITFAAAFGGNRIMYIAARDQSTGNSDWQPLGVWQVPFSPPVSISVTTLAPARSTVASGTAQQLSVTLTDTKGTGDLGIVDVLINHFLDGRQACYLAYVASSNSLILIDDAGEAGGPYAGSMALNGGSASIENSQCRVSGIGSSVTPGSNSLKLTLNVTFKSPFTGNRVIYAAGRDAAGGNNTDWQALGTISIQ